MVPDIAAFTDLKVTVLGRWPTTRRPALGADVEVRAFYADGRDFGEDPVTGQRQRRARPVAHRHRRAAAGVHVPAGSVIGREGRVRIEADGDRVWVSGDAVTRVVGEVDLG